MRKEAEWSRVGDLRAGAESELKDGGVDGADEDAPADQAQTFARFSSSGGRRHSALIFAASSASARARSYAT
jgi:hypothetical protein